MFISMLAINFEHYFEHYFAEQKSQRRKSQQKDDFDENQGLCQEKIKPITLDSIYCY